MDIVSDNSGNKFWGVFFVLVVVIVFTGFEAFVQYENFNNCKTKEHQTCPILNCKETDNTSPNGNNCANYAFRFDSSGNKICSGSIIYQK